MGIGDIVEMPLDPSHFVEYVFAHSWCYVYVMSVVICIFNSPTSAWPTRMSQPFYSPILGADTYSSSAAKPVVFARLMRGLTSIRDTSPPSAERH